MTSRRKRIFAALAAFLAFSFSQVYVQAGLPQRAITARLATKGNKPILVNGNNLGTGGTILTGATIETPDQVSALIDLGDAGVIELQPNSKIQLDFDSNGNVRVKAMRGCVVVKRRQNVLTEATTEVYTDQGATEKTDKKRRGMGFCYLPDGKLTPFGVAAGHHALWYGIAATGGGVTAAAIALSRGHNPSPAR